MQDRDETDVLVIGAGVAGLTCARRLAAAGRTVRVLDKGRGPGGRLSTRRDEVAGEALRFDHGAQYLTTRDPRFVAEVATWESAGAVARWDARIATLDAGTATVEASVHPRYVGVPSMSAICKHLAAGLDVTYGLRAKQISKGDRGFFVSAGPEDASIKDVSGELREFRARRVVVAVPDVQARELLGDMLAVPATVTEPCWAAMAAFGEPMAVGFDAARPASGPLAWASRESSKPGRPPAEAWVLHATPAWSREHLELKADEVAPMLLAALGVAIGTPLPKPTLLRAHRWRYAQTTSPAGVSFLLTPDADLGACGDYLLGGKIEAAFLSGLELADRLLG